jgi:hypothetical protein
MDLSDLFKECRVYTADLSTCDLLPLKQPAVYAFYDLMRFSSTSLIDQIDAFKTKHGRNLRMEKDEMPDRVVLRFRGNNPASFKGQGKQSCKSFSSEQAEFVARALMFLSFINEPLYIGKAEDVRARFRQHHDEPGFLATMKTRYGRPAGEFMFFFFQCDADLVRPLESILIQIINPPYCDQKC